MFIWWKRRYLLPDSGMTLEEWVGAWSGTVCLLGRFGQPGTFLSYDIIFLHKEWICDIILAEKSLTLILSYIFAPRSSPPPARCTVSSFVSAPALAVSRMNRTRVPSLNWIHLPPLSFWSTSGFTKSLEFFNFNIDSGCDAWFSPMGGCEDHC